MMFCCCQSASEVSAPVVEIQSFDEGEHGETADSASQSDPKLLAGAVESPAAPIAVAEVEPASSAAPAKRADGSAPAPPTSSNSISRGYLVACKGPLHISSREFDIAVEKDRVAGLDISAHDGITLLIGAVKEGPFSTWNQTVGPNCYEQVRRGDRIIEVNGCSGDSQAVLKAMVESSKLNVRIRRLVEFRVTFEKVVDLGVEFDETITKDLIITNVVGGHFQQLNKKSKVDMEMRNGDQIAEVNGQSGDAKTLMDLLEKRGSLDILIRRPSV